LARPLGDVEDRAVHPLLAARALDAMPAIEDPAQLAVGRSMRYSRLNGCPSSTAFCAFWSTASRSSEQMMLMIVRRASAPRKSLAGSPRSARSRR
jgi:hypothetical protein